MLNNPMANPSQHDDPQCKTLTKRQEAIISCQNKLEILKYELDDLVDFAKDKLFLDYDCLGELKDIYESKISDTTLELMELEDAERRKV